MANSSTDGPEAAGSAGGGATIRARQNEAIIEGEKRALELAVRDAPLSEILDVLVHTIEAHSPGGVLGSVLLVDDTGRHLRHGAAPSLPRAYRDAIDGLAIGPTVGSCGAAAFTGQTIIASDIAADPRWVDYRALALAHGLRACWSMPIFSTAGKVLGTFALYQRRACVPAVRDRQIVELLAHTAALVIERNAQKEQRRAAEAALELARAAAQEARDQHARRLAVLFRHAPVAIAVLRGPDHVFEVANRRYAELIGSRPVLGKPLRQALPELAGQGVFELVDEVFTTGQAYVGRSLAVTLRRGPGGACEECRFDFVYQPLPGDDGETESVIVVAFEVTELARARAEAEAANRAKDDFFAILGHELRNPLAPIATALQLMRLRGGDALEKERTIIERQVGHIMRLVDDLLDVSRVTRGKLELKKVPVELREVVASAIEMASPLVEERRHHLQVEVPAGLRVLGDPIRLAQIVLNVVTNAAKYTGSGGHIAVAAARVGDGVRLTVRDDGIGITPEVLPRIFEPFAQEHQGLERAHGGLGLGLAIVASLVKLHGGAVSAQSAGRGLGSTFTIELPLSAEAEERPASAVARAAEAARRPAAGRVLVVDDNQDAAEMLADALRVLGYEVVVAHDGEAAMRLVDEAAPDVALLDIGLPRMDGYELARQLRQAPGGARMRLVAITGYGQDSDRRRTLAAGFDAHLVKPVSIEAVTSLLASEQAARGG